MTTPLRELSDDLTAISNQERILRDGRLTATTWSAVQALGDLQIAP